MEQQRRTGQPHHDEEAFELTENGEFQNSRSYKISTYVDGTSIDWLHEEASERERNQLLRSKHGIRGLLLPLLDASRMWLVVILTGIGIGVAGACLDILVKW